MTSTTETSIGRPGGRSWFGISAKPPQRTTTFGTSDVDINPLLSNSTNNNAQTEKPIFESSVHWSTGILALLGVITNILVILLIYKKGLLQKDNRLVYYIFMSVASLVFGGTTATNTLSVSISDMNLFTDFGPCLLIQATAFGSFSMAGLCIVMLAHDLHYHIVTPISAPAADRIAGGVIKCVGCYFFAVLSAYLPFFFWSDHPAEVKTCTMSRIYGQHVHRANYLSVFTYIILAVALTATNIVLCNAIRHTRWQSTLRIQREIPTSQIRHCHTSEDLPPIEVIDDLQSNMPAKTTHDLTASKESIAIETNFDQSPEIDESLGEQTVEPDNKLTNATLLKTLTTQRVDLHDVLTNLDEFFVCGSSAEQKPTTAANHEIKQNLNESFILSASSLKTTRERILPEIADSEEGISLEQSPAIDPGINRSSSVQRSIRMKFDADLCCICCISSNKNETESISKRNGRSIEAESISSTESITKKHLHSREVEIRKYLKAVRTEVTLGLLYVFCILPCFVWNIRKLNCDSPCAFEDDAVRETYFLGMVAFPCIHSVLLLISLEGLRGESCKCLR